MILHLSELPDERDARPVSRSAQVALDAIRQMIVERRVSPGEQLRQEDLAGVLGISRSPVREALQLLLAEGLVSHVVNRGYFVARLSRDEMEQVYIMRVLLETAVYEQIRWPDGAALQELREINAGLAAAEAAGSVNELVRLNRRFHFRVFELSAFGYVADEIKRLWLRSEAYRAVYVTEASARRRVIREHEEMIQALADQDLPLLVAIADRHRQQGRERVRDMLAT